jgi:cytochrome c biogenesis protein CcmG, thiol:disulfide interchange protein DsbE
MRRLLYLLPALLFAVIGIGLAVGLTRDPGVLPSALIDRPVPVFTLPPIEGRGERGLSSDDLANGPALLNVFASWCVPCRIEHPQLDALAATGVPLYGLNYKDRPADVAHFLGELGDPFTAIGADASGRVAIDWGVYGVPETFVIDDKGRIVHRHVGPIMPRDLDALLALLERLRG